MYIGLGNSRKSIAPRDRTGAVRRPEQSKSRGCTNHCQHHSGFCTLSFHHSCDQIPPSQSCCPWNTLPTLPRTAKQCSACSCQVCLVWPQCFGRCFWFAVYLQTAGSQPEHMNPSGAGQTLLLSRPWGPGFTLRSRHSGWLTSLAWPCLIAHILVWQWCHLANAIGVTKCHPGAPRTRGGNCL